MFTIHPNARSISTTAATNVCFVFGGSNGGTPSSVGTRFNTIQRYVPSTNIRTTENATLPAAAIGMGGSSIGANIFLFGGNTPSGNVNAIDKFDGASLTVQSATLNSAKSALSAGNIGGTIYLASGGFAEIETFDGTTKGTASFTLPLPVQAATESSAVLGSTMFIFGGNAASTGNAQNAIQRITTSSSSMDSATLAHTSNGASAGTIGSNAFIIGGSYGNVALGEAEVNLTTIQRYDGTTRSTDGATINTSSTSGKGTTSIASVIYLFGGGFTQSGSGAASVYGQQNIISSYNGTTFTTLSATLANNLVSTQAEGININVTTGSFV